MFDIIKFFWRKFRALRKHIVFQIRYTFAKDIIDMPLDLALKKLNDIAPMPHSTSVADHVIHEKKYDLVIIVPAYNAEQWIAECVDSIISQETKYSYLAIIVDDGSLDQTGMILDSYLPNEHIQIIHQKNRGYSGARNVALQQLFSEYIMFVDSDDYLLPNTIELLMSKAISEKADIVEGNGVRFNENGRLGKVKDHDNTLWGGPCMKVMRAKLFEKIEFPEGYLYEDTIINSLIQPMANKVILLSDEVYAYRIHSESISRKLDKDIKRVDSIWIMLLIEQDRVKLGIADNRNLNYILQHIVFTYKRTQLLSEEVKKLIFVIECNYVKTYLRAKQEDTDKFDKLLLSLMKNDYAKYVLFCDNV